MDVSNEMCQLCGHDLHPSVYQLQCGHRVHWECIEKARSGGDITTCPGNDEECSNANILNDDHVHFDSTTTEELNNKDVYCLYQEHGCKVQMKWLHLNEHLAHCQYKLVMCPNNNRGCQVELPQYRMSSEHNDCQFKVPPCTAAELMKATLTHKAQCLQSNNTILTEYIDEEKQQTEILTEQLQAQEDYNNIIKAQLQKIDQKLEIELETSQQLQLNATSRANEARLQQLEATGNDSTEQAMCNANECGAKIQRQDKALGDVDYRLKCLETTSTNGQYVWKIDNYREQKNNCSIRSTPFYTSEGGYKMEGLVHLNEENEAQCRYLKLQFVLMKGPNDGCLRWPLKQKVTLKLLSQNTTDCVKEVFEVSFEKPEEEFHIWLENCLTVPHNVLESDGYLQNDEIYLMIEVDLSGLRIDEAKEPAVDFPVNHYDPHGNIPSQNLDTGSG